MRTAKLTVNDIRNKKNREKIIMLTCYDYAFANILDESATDILLVGDSLANVVLGLNQTRKVSIKEMINHTAAVACAVMRNLVIADMPYAAYQKNPRKSLYYARKFMDSGADAVKVEWFKDCLYVVEQLVKDGIPVMGHIGLTPQTAHLLGGYKVQGKDRDSALKLITQAIELEKLGIFSIVLECIPGRVAQIITAKLNIPTIGIGAGKYCDGQVLVLYDFLGLYKRIKPKFVRMYRDFSSEIKTAVSEYKKDIQSERFPSETESFNISEQELENVQCFINQLGKG